MKLVWRVEVGPSDQARKQSRLRQGELTDALMEVSLGGVTKTEDSNVALLAGIDPVRIELEYSSDGFKAAGDVWESTSREEPWGRESFSGEAPTPVETPWRCYESHRSRSLAPRAAPHA